MAAKIYYQEDFRAIGQALEGKNIRVFSLRKLGDWYLMRGVPDAGDSLRSKVQKFSLRFRTGSDTESLILGLSDVKALARKGKAKRAKAGRTPEFRKLSNILRTLGAYLESKHVDLIELKMGPLSVTLSYKDSRGRQQNEDRTIRSFYDLFLELCGKREEAKNDSQVQRLAG